MEPLSDCRWVSAWSTSPIDASLSETGVLDRLGVTVTDVSARTAVQLTAGGTHVRLTLSNIFGVLPLHVAACTVAIGADDARGIDPATLHTVTFGGQTHVRIGAGTSCTSDAAALPVTAGQALTVTVFYRGINAMRTIGLIGGCSHAELGNCTRRTMLHMAVPMQHTADSGAYEVIPALTEVDVLAAAGTHACVIFGDSTVANELPRLLAARLRADGIGNVSVTQAAIKGDRLVADGVGRAAKLLGGAGVKRFGRDVLGQAGADMVLVKVGANDLIHPHCRSKQGLLTPVTFAQMTAGYPTWRTRRACASGFASSRRGRVTRATSSAAGTTFSGRRSMTRCGCSSTPGSGARTAPPTAISRSTRWQTPTTRTRSSRPTRPTACTTPRPDSGRSPR